MNGCIMQTQHELPNVYLSTEQGELQHYLEPTTEAEHEALAAILNRIDPDQQQRNSNPTANLQNGGALSVDMSGG